MSLAANTLYYGDCLEWLPQFPSESVDLIYLDPPFNSNQDYNLLFGNGKPKSRGSRSAQVRAFDDTWRWDDSAAKRTDRLVRAAAHPAHKAVVGLRTMLGECGMLAYLSYMAERLAEMPRVLKHTGSIYLHCDPTASHGLKLVMDTIFGANNYLNEVTWQRTEAHNTADRYGNIADIIFFYAKNRDTHKWNGGVHRYGDEKYSDEQLARFKHEDKYGRRYKLENLTAPRPNSDSGKFEWRGTMPGSIRGWGYTLEQLEAWWADGRIHTKRERGMVHHD